MLMKDYVLSSRKDDLFIRGNKKKDSTGLLSSAWQDVKMHCPAQQIV
jgi:hypothetical protein